MPLVTVKNIWGNQNIVAKGDNITDERIDISQSLGEHAWTTPKYMPMEYILYAMRDIVRKTGPHTYGIMCCTKLQTYYCVDLFYFWCNRFKKVWYMRLKIIYITISRTGLISNRICLPVFCLQLACQKSRRKTLLGLSD